MNELKTNINNINKIPKYKKNNKTILKELLEIKNNKKIFLILSDVGYPSIGGGEQWLIDIMKYTYTLNYNPIMINFKDSNNNYFEKLNIIKKYNCTFIHFVKDYYDYINFIKYLQPHCIFHQGYNRLFYLKIANILNIPFITEFCFWQDIIEFNKKYSNIKMLNNIKNLSISNNFNDIIKYSSYVCVASDFVNNIVNKIYNIELPVLETISNIKNNKITNKKYITLININYYKNGWLVFDLLLRCKYPIILINTEKNNEEYDDKLNKLLLNRENVILLNKVENIQQIYDKTKILIIASLVDETFCKVAYEGIINKIPILSTNNGNLQYLLNGYADFILEDSKLFIKKINKIYNNKEYLNEMSNRIPINIINEDIIINKIKKILNIEFENKFTLDNNNIGMFVPWCDQGLGIQAREYYDELKKNGFNVYIMAFKPYNSNKHNILFQTDTTEWKYDNIFYYPYNREQITFENVIDFIHKSQISKMIFIEICYDNIFTLSNYFKLFNIKCIAIPNLEIIRIKELINYDVFDIVLCNNIYTLNL